MLDVRRVRLHGRKLSFQVVAALLLVVALAVSLTRAFGVWGESGSSATSGSRSKTAPAVSKPAGPATDASTKTVPLEPAARAVVRRFLVTAVARKNVGASYDLVAPALRQGMTRKEWATGNIPVVPYPLGVEKVAPVAVDFSYPGHALLEVTLLPDESSKGVKAQTFFVELQAYGTGASRRWLVTSWVPHGSPAVPVSGN